MSQDDIAMEDEVRRCEELALQLTAFISRMSSNNLHSAESIALRVVLDARARINAVTHIGRLPVELLVVIFTYVAIEDDRVQVNPSELEETKFPSFDPRYPLALTHVCRGWRNLALAIPSLWAQIDSRWKASYEAYISRADTTGITLRQHDSSPHEPYRQMREICRQLRRLDVVGFSLQTLSVLEHLDMPQLECFTAFSMSLTLIVQTWQLRNLALFRGAALRALALGGVGGGWLPTNMHFVQLTHLYLSPSLRFAASHLREMLANTPALQHLHFDNHIHRLFGLTPESNDSNGPVTPVILPSLRGVVLAALSLSDSLTLLRHLHMPKSSLTQDVDSSESSVPIPSLEPLTSRTIIALQLCTSNVLHIVALTSNRMEGLGFWLSLDKRVAFQMYTLLPLCGLEYLSIATRYHTLLPALLPHLPCLVDLRVAISLPPERGFNDGQDYPKMSEAVCTALGQSRGSDILCGRLRTLALRSFWDASPAAFSPRTLIDMASMRDGLGCRLRQIIIQHPCYYPNEQDERDAPAARQLFRDTFVPALSKHVDEVTVLEDEEPESLDSGEVRPAWATPDAERYWLLPQAWKANNYV
ncbi:hypothetical protein K466DRAFT_587439 [Polyporus arcularius HHB13444]|uniref:Uncharacterized protein n=1 Tax=Polyporus arcularius HHB13444 TaxID=1314778 RepID=A0A5C3PD66_9APHY|nr:hypothetical protein K466DRAFT_587439 [Polyporus arcularius HHB13444]